MPAVRDLATVSPALLLLSEGEQSNAGGQRGQAVRRVRDLKRKAVDKVYVLRKSYVVIVAGALSRRQIKAEQD